MIGKVVVLAVLGAMFTGCSMFLSYSISDEDTKEAVSWRTGSGNLHNAIITGAAQKGWTVVGETADSVTLQLNLRGNVVVVDVFHGTTEFMVKYKDSKNMGYDPSTGGIHGKYITWVRHLKSAIKNSAARM